MIIKHMRANFGGLQQQELTLSPGLNIIEAPNEAGKSTWSAFLRAMLYGINTKERDRQGYIAEKNRYQPWNGGAMEGSIALIWQGKEITLRRSPKGNTPFGKFEAVYTATGAPVAELTGENCGEMLLGVPRAVYERSAFVGQGSIAIDGAPALEGRIAALSSSGEEEVSYSQVERRLKDWRNRRQHNKTGIIPKTEQAIEELDAVLSRLSSAHRTSEQSRGELTRLERERAHLTAELAAHQSCVEAEQQERYAAALAARRQAEEELEHLRAEEARLPDAQCLRDAQGELSYLNTLNANIKLAQRQSEEAERAAQDARAAAHDPVFSGQSPDEARRQAEEDTARFRSKKHPEIPVGISFFALAVLLAGVLLYYRPGQLRPEWLAVALTLVCGAVNLARGVQKRRRDQAEQEQLLKKYSTESSDGFSARAAAYCQRFAAAEEAETKARSVKDALEQLIMQREEMTTRLLALTRAFAPEINDLFGVSAALSRALSIKERLTAAQVRLEGAARLVESLPRPQGQAGPVPAGLSPRFDAAETAARLTAAEGEISRLNRTLAMAQGELKTLGNPDELHLRREALDEELSRRRTEYDALTLALDTLGEAHLQLQERFSPALNRHAGEWMARLTGGKYDAVTLTRQFEALAAEEGGLSPRRAISLSRGTADQLYLAVRLAVCALALPGDDPAPLVLDDALTNFDNARCALALDALEELAQERQILLFTCHSREGEWAVERNGVQLIRL